MSGAGREVRRGTASGLERAQQGLCANSGSGTGLRRNKGVARFPKVVWTFTDTLPLVLDSARVELVSQ